MERGPNSAADKARVSTLQRDQNEIDGGRRKSLVGKGRGSGAFKKFLNKQ